MAAIQPIKTKKNEARRYTVAHPATLEVIGEFEVVDAAGVRAAVQKSRDAQKVWREVPVQERVKKMYHLLDVFLENQEHYIDVIMRDTGRGRVETILMEIIATADCISHYCKSAKSDLADHTVGLQTVLKAKKLVQTYRPLGVVGVIVPWNGPFVMSMNQSVPAVLAGNGVIIKPSEITPFSGSLAEKLFADAGFPEGLVQAVKGDGETGAALIEAGVDKISFTGSTATGRKVGAACGQALIPFSLELGGKDAAIVCADANLDRAAAGVVAGCMFNTGQFCCGTERCYVVESVADEFIAKVVQEVRNLKQHWDGSQDISAMIAPQQVDIIEEHVEDAKKKGARVLIGGKRHEGFDGAAYEATVLVDVTHSMTIMRDETFGPVLPIMVVKDENEAIAMANDSHFGLSGTLWTKDKAKGLAIAKQLETGSVCVNETAMTYGAHNAPFGGMKQSGVGYVHGEKSIRQFTQPVPVIIDRLGLKTEQNWYPLTREKGEGMQKFMNTLFGNKVLRWFA